MASRLNQRHHLKYKICVSGAAETGHCAIDALEKTEQIGRAIAEAGMVLVPGATTEFLIGQRKARKNRVELLSAFLRPPRIGAH